MESASDLATVDSNEFADLTTLVRNTDFIKMPEDVRNLSQKAILGDPANKAYKGNTFSNLYVNAPATHLDNLSNKWFRGGDLPAVRGEYAYGSGTYQYRAVSGSLIQNGVQYRDVYQGAVADCYYLAALEAVALRQPQTIASMFVDNNDGTFSVRHWNGSKAEYVTVNRWLPTDSVGSLPFAKLGYPTYTFDNPNNELWVALAEKAYVQMSESGWSGQGQPSSFKNTNDYSSIEFGDPSLAVSHINNSSRIYKTDFRQLLADFNAGKFIILASDDFTTTKGSPVVYWHAYPLVGYNSAMQTFTLDNPWGVDNNSVDPPTVKPAVLNLSLDQIDKYFMGFVANQS
jgi:hypothetical protein